jgi:hypothetical protein
MRKCALPMVSLALLVTASAGVSGNTRSQALAAARHKCGTSFAVNIKSGYWRVDRENGEWIVIRYPRKGNGNCLYRQARVSDRTGRVLECGPCVRVD